MKLYSWNVNGIRAVTSKGTFQSFIAEHTPDVLCLQETKARPEQVELALDGYHTYWSSAKKAGYSGTALFTRQKPLQVVEGFSEAIRAQFSLADSYGDTTEEGRVLSAEFDDFWIVTVYTPNTKADLSRLALRHEAWDRAFLAHVTSLEADKPVLWCGDLNVAHREIDLANPKANVGKHGFTNEERAGFDAYLQAGYLDSFRVFSPDTPDAYTWWTHWANARARNVGWRIDYWMVSEKLQGRLQAAAIHPDILGSDHCPVSITIKD